MADQRSSEDLADFLAHALAMEEDTAACYRELAKEMRQHGNIRVANLFSELAEFEAEDAAAIRARAKGMVLPRIPPWHGAARPGATICDRPPHLVTEHDVLSLALEREQQARHFFDSVAAGAADPAIRDLAHELALEEAGHIARVHCALAQDSTFPSTESERKDLHRSR
ncbi:MAG TPA: ferritin family protein [Alphaproteobacteria bacterium]|nr:ferritin family protein [Alphaproteobacteria bacterium]